jgi:hypothetical protein
MAARAPSGLPLPILLPLPLLAQEQVAVNIAVLPVPVLGPLWVERSLCTRAHVGVLSDYCATLSAHVATARALLRAAARDIFRENRSDIVGNRGRSSPLSGSRKIRG